MKKLNNLIKEVGIPDPAAQQDAGSSSAEPPGAGNVNCGPDLVDAINQMFAEFELAYHNQFHKAYAREGSVGVAKKYWLSCLSRFSPAVLLQATRQVVSSQEYLPSLSIIIHASENALSLSGLPAPHDAYIEACNAPEPKAEYDWSHTAVYFAGRATDWFTMKTQPESRVYPLFEYHYRLLCSRVMKGESLEVSLPQALPETSGKILSPDENQEKLKTLRENLKL